MPENNRFIRLKDRLPKPLVFQRPVSKVSLLRPFIFIIVEKQLDVNTVKIHSARSFLIIYRCPRLEFNLHSMFSRSCASKS